MMDASRDPLLTPEASQIEFTAIRAQGPGGQNVNKVSNAIQLRFDIRASSLPDAVKERLLGLSDHRITGDGVVVIKAQRYRSLEKNREDVDPDATFTEPPEPEGLMPETLRSPFAYLLWCMERNDAFDSVVAGTAETLLGTGENERGSILSTARRNTAFLDTLGPRYKATLSGEFRPFDPDHLKGAPEGVSVYLCLPAERIGTHGRWLRLMIGLFLEKMQRQLIEPASKAPVLFLLEEFFALGPMPSIEKAAGYAAGFGVKLWAILQDLQQLKSLYRTSWQTFLANAGAIQIFGASDRETLEYASKAMGEIEVSRVTASTSAPISHAVQDGTTTTSPVSTARRSPFSTNSPRPEKTW